MHVDDFLSRLSRVKRQSGDNGWLASCPSHGGPDGDRNPSLSIKSDGSKTLLKCFAGCSVESILSAMGLDTSALFEVNKTSEPKRTITAVYDYTDAAGVLLFQAVRYTPKGFSQRRPDGNGGWYYNLHGVQRVVYRWQQIHGKRSILFVEGERDVERAWAMQIPATCNPMGAGKWDQAYAAQLRSAGVQRICVIPDNDKPGELHAQQVAAGLTLAGFDVRLLRLPNAPPHGDLSDYLATHTREDLVPLLKGAPKWDPETRVEPTPDGPDREFKPVGERRYTMTIRSAGLQMDVDHVRRERDGTNGELLVRVNGYFPNAKTYSDGVLSVGDFNLSSVNMRSTRAKLLQERSGDKEFDWFGTLEQFVVDVLTHEREGEPPVVLGAGDDLPEPQDGGGETWEVGGIPILVEDPMVLYGDSASGKSYLALWIAGTLAERGIKVLYVDWEYSEKEHRKRLRRLFVPTPKGLHYARADSPITKEAQRLKRLISEHGYQYLICDSIGFAVEGPAETHEAARGYFSALRQCGIGSLSLAHIAKNRDDGKEATIFGSTFFRAGARSAWFIDRAAENAKGELHVGLHHRKSNASYLLKPIAYKFTFNKARVSIERVEMSEIAALASQLPLIDRLRQHMTAGELYAYKDLAEDLGVPADSIRKTLARSKGFKRIGRKISLVEIPKTTTPPPSEEVGAPHPKDTLEF